MFELADRLIPILARGEQVVLATSIDIVGSSPSLLGTSMALPADGVPIGQVSGGCVETAALEGCRRMRAVRDPHAARFGFGDDAAVRAGLACGGEVDVLFHEVAGDAVLRMLQRSVEGLAAAAGVVTGGPAGLVGALVLPSGNARTDGLGRALAGEVDAAMRDGVTRTVVVPNEGGDVRMFVEVVRAAPDLVLIGATDVAAAVAVLAVPLGFRITVVEQRAAFADRVRVPAAHRVVEGYPHVLLADLDLGVESVVCVLSHDEDLDPLALAAALDGGAGYVGALGSRATHRRRVERLRALGVDDATIGRIHAPIGLDIGASTAAETAVSIVAEIIAVRRRASGQPLTRRTGPIHQPIPSGA